MSYFSQSKSPGDAKPQSQAPQDTSRNDEMISTIGPSMTITGKIVSPGPIEIHGRVDGDIHASKLVIAAGAFVEGDVSALDAIIQGEFKGTLRANSVKLTGSAVVNGEVHNRSLSIDQNAQFEGVSRRLQEPVVAPAQGLVPQGAVVDLSVAREGLLN
jgi:cytoskeletal protein CcmA (bactofilin family)